MAAMTLVAEPGSHQVVMTRVFNAPRDLVFKAFTDPTLIPKWWGPTNVTTTVDKMDVRAGGLWRYVQHDSDGNEYGFHGVYHDIVSPESLVFTFEWEGMPGHVLMETVMFTEQDGKTLMTDSSVFQSVEDRDGMIQSGMEHGAKESWDRFEAVLQEMK